MPKKIKPKEQKSFSYSEEEKKANTLKKVILGIIIVGILICTAIGLYVGIKDSQYQYSQNPIVLFSYSEGRYEEGYDVYEIEVREEGTHVMHNLGKENQLLNEDWSKYKLLDFNEKLYESGVFDFEEAYVDETEEELDWSFRIEIVLENGEIFTSYGFDKHPENTEKFRALIKEFFNSDIEL